MKEIPLHNAHQVHHLSHQQTNVNKDKLKLQHKLAYYDTYA